jgi:hypothetical protein
MSTVENNDSKFRCNICDKSYKDKSGIWYHNKKYHKDSCKLNVNHNDLHSDKVEIYVSQKSTNVSLDDTQICKDNIDGYSCNYCGTIYLHRQSKYKHQLKCKNKIVEKEKLSGQNQKEIINLLMEEIKTYKEQFKEQEKQNQEIKKTLMNLINKNCKVHHKTLQKINKQLTGDHNTINENNNINKGTINNTYNIIALGHENLTDVFSKKEKMNILKYRFNSLSQLVEYAHFNDKYPQFKNILITNTQNKLAYRYDIKKKQFVAVNKDDLLEDIVDARMFDINSFYEELEEELDTKTKEILDKVKDKIDSDPAYKELKKQDIKLIIYNNRKKVIKDAPIVDEIEV